VCDELSGQTPFTVNGQWLLINCDEFQSYLFNPSTGKSTTTSSIDSFYPPAFTATGLAAIQEIPEYFSLYIPDLAATPVINSKLTAYSNPVFVNGELFVFGFLDTFASSEGLTLTPALYRLDTVLGLSLGMATTKNNNNAGQQLMAVSGGIYGSGTIYLYSTNVSSFYAGSSLSWSWDANPPAGVNIESLGGPLATSTGGFAYYGTDGNLHVLDAFNGVHAWWAPVILSTPLPLMESNSLLFYSNGDSIIGADIYTGVQRTALSFSSNTITGFGVINGSNNVTTIIGASGGGGSGNTFLFSSAAQLMPSQGSFSGGNNNNSGGAAEASKAWIAAIVVGLLVVVIAVVVVSKMKGKSASSDQDYVPMNPATQV